MANGLERVPIREREPKIKVTNFEEVCYGYNREEAGKAAARGIHEYLAE